MKRLICILLACVFLFLTASCGKTPQDETPKPQDAQPQATYTARPARWSKKEAVFAAFPELFEGKA